VVKIFGIEVRIHPSWIFIFALVAWSLSSAFNPFGMVGIGTTERVLLGILGALLFFASVLIHELAHSLLARSKGIPISGITLMIFGGVSQFSENPRTPPSAAWIAAIGPLTSLALGALFYGCGAAAAASPPLKTLFGYLAAANVTLAAFNFLPAIPLDGGRVLHAVLWRATGDRLRATRIAVAVSKGFAWLIIAFGAWEAFAFGFGGGLWLAFIGWFLFQASTAEELQAQLDHALQGHSIVEVSTWPERVITPDTSVGRALEALAQTPEHALPVMLGDRFLGIVTASQAAHAERDAYVTSVMTRAESLPSVDPRMKALDALRTLATSEATVLPVLDQNGTFYGLVTPANLMRWVANDRDRGVRTTAGRFG
jgi:Zn-dependent protease/predicted transcriptional regulator